MTECFMIEFYKDSGNGNKKEKWVCIDDNGMKQRRGKRASW